MRNSVVSASQRRRRYAKRLSSASEAFELVVIIGRESKLNSAFFVRRLRVLLLRHIALKGYLVVLAETDQRDGVTSVMVEYVIHSQTHISSIAMALVAFLEMQSARPVQDLGT